MREFDFEPQTKTALGKLTEGCFISRPPIAVDPHTLAVILSAPIRVYPWLFSAVGSTRTVSQ